MNLKKRLALGVFISTLLAFSAYYAEYLPFTGSSAGKLLGRITGIGPGRYNRCGGSVQALCHEAGRMTVL